MKSYHRAYVEVNLDHIKYNLESIQKNLPKETKIMAVVKADGYGHGSVQVAKEVEELSFLFGFGVATATEAFILRKSGINKPILILGSIFEDEYKQIIEENISVNVYREDLAFELFDVARELHKTVSVHIKIDTGMSRLGFSFEEESLLAIENISKQEECVLEGIFTHFANADDKDKISTNSKYQLFMDGVNLLGQRGVEFKIKHCGNSAISLDLPDFSMNMVRVGISLYGLYPSEDINKARVHLKPAMSFHSVLTSVKKVKAGVAVSYGETYVTPSEKIIATIPVGYADGYPRSLSNQGYVLIHGKKAPIIGRICMDQFMVDVTEIKEASYMSQVTLIGSNGEENIQVEELGDLSGKFNYEFICGIGKRIPRNYRKNGEIVEQVDYFNSSL